MPRKLHFFSASSLDGFIARENGDISWLFTDQDYGYNAFFSQVDTVLMGRKTYEVCRGISEDLFPGRAVVVFSRVTAPPSTPATGLVWTDADPVATVRDLKARPGRDLWIVGGAGISTELLQAGLIDEWVVSIHPVLLGGGIPLFATPFEPFHLKLTHSQAFDTGLVQLRYVKKDCA